MHEKFVATKSKRESLVMVIRSFNTFNGGYNVGESCGNHVK